MRGPSWAPSLVDTASVKRRASADSYTDSGVDRVAVCVMAAIVPFALPPPLGNFIERHDYSQKDELKGSCAGGMNALVITKTFSNEF